MEGGSKEMTPNCCRDCGNMLVPEARFCPHCGSQVGRGDSHTPTPTSSNGRSRTRTGLATSLTVLGVIALAGSLYIYQAAEAAIERREALGPWGWYLTDANPDDAYLLRAVGVAGIILAVIFIGAGLVTFF